MLYGCTTKSGKRITRCKCLCECGKEKIINADMLKNKDVSCGCVGKKNSIIKNRVDLTGKTFGKLTVLEMNWDVSPTKCICLCECGNISYVINTGLTSGKTTSCGCHRRKMQSISNTKDFTGYISDYGVELIKRSYKNNHGTWVWECKCFCGDTFYEIPAKIKNGHTTSCGCASRSSKERLIEHYLKSLSIDYKTQYKMDGCVYKSTLRFDFALFKDGKICCLLEYDGKQHFEPIDFFGGAKGFEDATIRDNIKNAYCKEHNINLIRIPYTYSDEEIYKTIQNIINA